jgi:carbon monoxide dehydrogenase subunit G
MELEHSFTALAAVDDVWRLLLDIERITPCLPGAEVLARTGEHKYDVAMKLTLGPMRMRYVGACEITDIDVGDHSAVLIASAQEARGQGAARAGITMRLAQTSEGARVGLTTDLTLTGRVAQMGRGLVEQVADEMLRDFAACLSIQLRSQAPADGAEVSAPAAQSEPDEVAKRGVNPLALLLRSLIARLRSRFRRGGGT